MSTPRVVKVKPNYEVIAWKWMRYTAILLIPLAWFHMILQDVLVGVHRIDLNYVQMRWAFWGWRVYDFFLLAFAFAHGVNGLRQVLLDYVHSERGRAVVSWGLLFFWLIISLIGAIAILGGVRMPSA
ncbi:MAG: succinate dehydrogenase, hydrophobic membrane anchor protein [Anaerolineales bacterium]